MTKKMMIDNGLSLKDNRFVASVDKNLIGYMNKNIDLGNGFKFIRYSGENTRFGDIEWSDKGEYSYGTVVVYIEWSNTEKVDLQYRMLKSAPVDRKFIIAACAKFMKIYHETLEPYMNNNTGGGNDLR